MKKYIPALALLAAALILIAIAFVQLVGGRVLWALVLAESAENPAGAAAPPVPSDPRARRGCRLRRGADGAGKSAPAASAEPADDRLFEPPRRRWAALSSGKFAAARTHRYKTCGIPPHG